MIWITASQTLDNMIPTTHNYDHAQKWNKKQQKQQKQHQFHIFACRNSCMVSSPLKNHPADLSTFLPPRQELKIRRERSRIEGSGECQVWELCHWKKLKELCFLQKVMSFRVLKDWQRQKTKPLRTVSAFYTIGCVGVSVRKKKKQLYTTNSCLSSRQAAPSTSVSFLRLPGSKSQVAWTDFCLYFVTCVYLDVSIFMNSFTNQKFVSFVPTFLSLRGWPARQTHREVREHGGVAAV